MQEGNTYTWTSPEIPPLNGEIQMELRLVYQGKLKGGNNRTSDDVQIVRQQFNPQLEQFWKTQYPAKSSYDAVEHFHKLSRRLQTRDVYYLPLVGNPFGNVCSLDILLLRRGKQRGQIFTPTGDIDNQISTLFDALKWPKQSENVGTNPDIPSCERGVFYCLVEDDSLITQVRVTTDVLMTPPPTNEDHPENHVLAIINVVTARSGTSLHAWIDW